MPGPRFIRLAQRIHAYGGAVAALIHTELDEQCQNPAAASTPVRSAPPAARPAGAGSETKVIGGTRAELTMSEELSGLISFGTA